MDKAELRARFGRLLSFVGDWQGEERMTASPWSAGGSAMGRHHFEVVAGGTALAQSYRQSFGTGGLSGHGVFTLDPLTGEVLWFWFDDFGYPPLDPARGDWEQGTLTLSKRTPRGETVYRFTPHAEGWRQEIRVRPSGQADFDDFLAARYTRAGQERSSRVSR